MELDVSHARVLGSEGNLRCAKDLGYGSGDTPFSTTSAFEALAGVILYPDG